MLGTPCSLSELRFALRHLYEPSALRRSPLLGVLRPDGEADAVASLRLALASAIESLKPGLDAPPQSPARRAYEILYYRYVQQCTTDEVADQVGLSRRHLKREHRKALERLALSLAERHNLVIEIAGGDAGRPTPEPQELTEPARAAVRWAGAVPQGKAAELGTVLPALLSLVQPIATRYETRVEVAAVGSLPPLAVDAVALRQMLLSVLCVAIRQAAQGTVAISARPQPWQVTIELEATSPAPQPALLPEDAANIDVALQLAQDCRGNLVVAGDATPFRAALTLPAAQQVPVLVVDDHADALQLVERYLTDTRYRVYGAQSAEQALALAGEISPQAIVLDVMMPEVDGWELLGRLKQHPLTGGIPVIASTIVAQEELALALGVSVFLRKPLSRRDLLAALDQLVPRAES